MKGDVKAVPPSAQCGLGLDAESNQPTAKRPLERSQRNLSMHEQLDNSKRLTEQQSESSSLSKTQSDPYMYMWIRYVYLKFALNIVAKKAPQGKRVRIKETLVAEMLSVKARCQGRGSSFNSSLCFEVHLKFSMKERFFLKVNQKENHVTYKETKLS